MHSSAALLGFVQALSGVRDVEELARRFDRAFKRVFDVPMYGFYIREPWTGAPCLVTSANVSDVFLARYERHGREVDCMQQSLAATAKPAYNIGLMTMGEWLEHPLYTRVKRLHDVRHEIQTPVVGSDGIIGNVNFGTSDPARGFTPPEVDLAAAVGHVLGVIVEQMQSLERVERERDMMKTALELTGTAVVVSAPGMLEPRLNDSARRLMARVAGGDELLYRLLAGPPGTAGFSRHVEVELSSGGTGMLCAHSRRVRSHGDGLLTVLELQCDGGEISPQTLIALTPREREVVLLIVDGLTDREIAERLVLSPLTVSQYVKCVYRKLDVDSRVALTRLLLDSRSDAHPRS